MITLHACMAGLIHCWETAAIVAVFVCLLFQHDTSLVRVLTAYYDPQYYDCSEVLGFCFV
jgi:hypothetical protein